MNARAVDNSDLCSIRNTSTHSHHWTRLFNLVRNVNSSREKKSVYQLPSVFFVVRSRISV
jgi:hypothetical protein